MPMMPNSRVCAAGAINPLSTRMDLETHHAWQMSGVAPVTKRSGKSCLVIMRYAAQVRLRNAVFHWARVAVLNDPKCRSRYAALRARGHSYGRALRGVADRLLGVACVLLQRQVLFDPDHGTRAAP